MTLEQILQQRQIPYHTIRHHGQRMLMICCPFCATKGESADTRFRLGVNAQNHWAKCFNCGYTSKNVIRHLLRALRLGKTDVDGEVGAAGPVEEPATLPEGYYPLASRNSMDELDVQAHTYLTQRGVSLEQIRRKHIGATFVGRYAYRIVFPVYAATKLNGIVARALYPQMEPRYLNSRGTKALYNYQALGKTVILLEGVFKALRVENVLRSVAPVEACALLGHDITELQLDQLVQGHTSDVVLWPDPDSVGRKGMVKVAEKLRNVGIALSIAPAHVPADEASVESLRESWQRRVPFTWAVAERLLV